MAISSSVVVVAGARTPFVKIGTTLRYSTAIDLGIGPVNSLVDRFSLSQDFSGLLVFGTVIPHSEVSNIAREIALESKLHPQIPAFSTVMACATGLSAIAEASQWIMRKTVPWAIAGGSESMSNFPMAFSKKVQRAASDI